MFLGAVEFGQYHGEGEGASGVRHQNILNVLKKERGLNVLFFWEVSLEMVRPLMTIA